MSTNPGTVRVNVNANAKSNIALPVISRDQSAFSHLPERGFSLFLANRTKTIHFVRRGEGTHNEANRAVGDDSPVTFSTPGAWKYIDAPLTETGVQQCLEARNTLLNGINPELVIVSPFTRTLQTAHLMFGGGKYSFMVHDCCRERSGRFTCDKRRPKSEILAEVKPLYEQTGDRIDFERFGYATENDEFWTEDREPSESVTNRAIQMMQWIATRPEKELAVVTHSSWLKHLFRAFGQQISEKDMGTLHRLAGNAEVRSVTLALHRGFYPEGKWEIQGDSEHFVPHDITFRRGRWAPTDFRLSEMHKSLLQNRTNSESKK